MCSQKILGNVRVHITHSHAYGSVPMYIITAIWHARKYTAIRIHIDMHNNYSHRDIHLHNVQHSCINYLSLKTNFRLHDRTSEDAFIDSTSQLRYFHIIIIYFNFTCAVKYLGLGTLLFGEYSSGPSGHIKLFRKIYFSSIQN